MPMNPEDVTPEMKSSVRSYAESLGIDHWSELDLDQVIAAAYNAVESEKFSAMLELIPAEFRIQCREGGGFEDKEKSLCLSIARLVSNVHQPEIEHSEK